MDKNNINEFVGIGEEQSILANSDELTEKQLAVENYYSTFQQGTQSYSSESSQYNASKMNGEFGNSELNSDQPGRGSAIASLVLGIVSIVFWFFGAGAVIGLVTGIVGIICSSSAKKSGFNGGIQVAGFICSLIGLIGSAMAFVACVACAGVIASGGF